MPQTTVLDRMTVAVAGMPGDEAGGLYEYESGHNENASASLFFGRMAKVGSEDDGAATISAATDLLKGVLVRTDGREPSVELAADGGLAVNMMGTFMRRGRIWAEVEEAVTPASVVRLRVVADTEGPVGRFADTADAGKTVKLNSARYLSTTTAAGELVLVEFDLLDGTTAD